MSNIPNFPEFIRLSVSHKELLRALSRQFPPYSDFNFVSLFTWDTDEIIAVSLLHDNLVVRFSDYENDEIFLSLLGSNQLKITLPTLFDYCKTSGINKDLQLVPNSVIEAMHKGVIEDYVIEEDRDNHDYIMSVDALLKGGIARNKRRSYNRFINEFGPLGIKCTELDLTNRVDVEAINDVILSWRAAKHISKENEKEFVAIDRCLRHSNSLDVSGYGVTVEDTLVAFIIFELVSDSTAMLHFGKSNHGLPGAFDYIKVEIARHLQQYGIKFLNFEQDLGIDGLRVDKLSFRPAEFLKKYTISQKP